MDIDTQVIVIGLGFQGLWICKLLKKAKISFIGITDGAVGLGQGLHNHGTLFIVNLNV